MHQSPWGSVMEFTLRIILSLSIALLMAGCKLAVIVVEGGEVESYHSGICAAGTICIVDVTDPGFSESFRAIPDSDWYFQKWNSGDRFFCDGSSDIICTLSFHGHEDSKAVGEMVASSEVFYIMPVFRQFTDIITVDGKEWLQPKLFLGLSWKDINAVCPDGKCFGRLNGYDMSGWTWASADDVSALFNYYIGSNILGAAPYSYLEGESKWAPAFFSDGWQPTDVDDLPRLKAVEGWLRSLRNRQNAYYAHILYSVGPVFESYDQDRMYTQKDEIARKIEDRGGWFYRTP